MRRQRYVLASGGAGWLFERTTNFPGTEGTGYALALEAGAELVDMEFVSFEPTVAVAPAAVAGMELPTMAFSEGVRLLNARREEFICTLPPPSKDIMSRAILREVREGRGTETGAVYYDLSEMAPEDAVSYSQIRRALKALNLGSRSAQIEVRPTQHYLMGGIATDAGGGTAVASLYAAGEVAGGATAPIVWRRVEARTPLRSVRSPASRPRNTPTAGAFSWRALRAAAPELLLATMEDRRIWPAWPASGSRLSVGCGAVREGAGLQAAVAQLEATHAEIWADGRLCSWIGRAVVVALAIARSAAARQESRGDHFRIDHPHRDDRRWLGNLRLRADADAAVRATYLGAGITARSPGPGATRNEA